MRFWGTPGNLDVQALSHTSCQNLWNQDPGVGDFKAF